MKYKLKSIRIIGMHNEKDTTYELEDFNYICGKNGCGKSTILQSIQLGLLGYIPGYKHTNTEIFKHCNNNVTMGVSLNLSDGNNTYTITRSWNRSGKSITYSEDIPENLNLKEILSDIELPIFNFSEFTNQSSNSMKDWFIKFLPNSADKLDMEKEIDDAVSNITTIDSNFTDDIKNWWHSSNLDKSLIDRIALMNAHMKEMKSSTDASIKQLQSTLQSMTYYDDVPNEISKDDLNIQILNLKSKINDYIKTKSNLDRKTDLISKLNIMKSMYSTSEMSDSDFLEFLRTNIEKQDKAIFVCESKLSDLNTSKSKLVDDVKTKNEKIYELDRKLGELKFQIVENDMCPYTKVVCNNLKEVNSNKYAEQKQINDMMTELVLSVDSDNNKVKQINDQIDAIKKDLDNFSIEKTEFKNRLEQTYHLIDSIQKITDENIEIIDISEVQTEIDEKTKLIGKLEENNRFKEFNSKLTSDIFKLQTELEICKELVKLSGQNGISSRLAIEPFKNLENVLNKYLSTVFENDIESKFIISSATNSFDFGIVRNNSFISYKVLSSGEKAMYMFCLLISLIEISNNDLPILLIDDALDHLDKSNFDSLYKFISESNIQLICAGVISPYADKDIDNLTILH